MLANATAVPVTARDTVTWPPEADTGRFPFSLEFKIPTLIERETIASTLAANGCIAVQPSQMRAAILEAAGSLYPEEAEAHRILLETFWAKSDEQIDAINAAAEGGEASPDLLKLGPTKAEEESYTLLNARLMQQHAPLQEMLAAATRYETLHGYLTVAILLAGWTFAQPLVRERGRASDRSMDLLHSELVKAGGEAAWPELKAFAQQLAYIGTVTEKNSDSPLLKQSGPTSSPTASSGNSKAPATKRIRRPSSRKTAAR